MFTPVGICFCKLIVNFILCIVAARDHDADFVLIGGLTLLGKNAADSIFAVANDLVHSNNPWERRLALLMTECFTRDPAYHAAIRRLVSALSGDKEYYVKKAVTWINRSLEKKSRQR